MCLCNVITVLKNTKKHTELIQECTVTLRIRSARVENNDRRDHRRRARRGGRVAPMNMGKRRTTGGQAAEGVNDGAPVWGRAEAGGVRRAGGGLAVLQGPLSQPRHNIAALQLITL